MSATQYWGHPVTCSSAISDLVRTVAHSSSLPNYKSQLLHAGAHCTQLIGLRYSSLSIKFYYNEVMIME